MNFSVSKKSNWLPIWKGIQKIAPILSASSAWSIGNRATTKFWLDDWVEGAGPLIDRVTSPNAVHDVEISVADMFNKGLPNVMQSLPAEVYEKLQATCAPLSTTAADKRIWKNTLSRKFTLSSAIQFLLDKPTEELRQPPMIFGKQSGNGWDHTGLKLLSGLP